MLNRPLPVEDVESEAFWQGCREGRLLIQKCGDHYQFPPTSYCTHCLADAPQWIEASGRGSVFSWIVVHVPIPAAIYADQVPYITALVTLEEGPRICANLTGIAPENVRDGLSVEAYFEVVGDGSVVLPFFRPTA